MDVDVFIKNLDMLMEELDRYLDESNLDDDWHCGYDAGMRDAYKLIITCRDGFVDEQTQEKEDNG